MNPLPVQDSGPDLHPYVTLARTVEPEWRERAHGAGWEWIRSGVFCCLAYPTYSGWEAQVVVEGPIGTQTWRISACANRQSAQSNAEVALTHLLTLQDASEFWRASL